VNDGLHSALQQAQAAAGVKVVMIMGADIAQQILKDGLADEIHLQLVPVLLGRGIRLFENLGLDTVELTCERAVNSPYITHLRYRIVK
jgi:dihydrofolate reductase